MSATGQGGVSLIASPNSGNTTGVAIPNGQSLKYTHNVGKKAYQVLVTDPNGNILNVAGGITVTQSTGVITVANSSGGALTVFIEARWEENSAEVTLVPSNSAALVVS